MTIEHSVMTDPELHEPKGISVAASGQVYEADGLGSGAWTTPVSLFDPADIITQPIMVATSVASSQEPSALDTPLQVEIGPAQNTGADPVMIDVNGLITFNEAGTYRLDVTAHFGRTGGAGVSYLMTRELINGVQQGNSLASRLDDSDVLLPFSFETWLTVPASTTAAFEVIRDSAGNNSGGLFRQESSNGWVAAPSFSVTISKLIK
jgi:hypothetical protein